MSAVVRLRVRQATDVIAVPAAAVFSAEGHDAVWVRRDDGTAERRIVRIGVSGMDMLQVIDGLREGEQIVIRGVDLVKAGDRLP
jgi:multidrug efflux pump subunit AcrA (membrane-fusion protein)